MKVKIGVDIFDSKDIAITLNISDNEKKEIATSSDFHNIFCFFTPDDTNIETMEEEN